MIRWKILMIFLRHLTAIFRRMTFCQRLTGPAAKNKPGERESGFVNAQLIPVKLYANAVGVWCHGAIIVDHQRMFGILIDRETVNLQSASLECGNQSDV